MTGGGGGRLRNSRRLQKMLRRQERREGVTLNLVSMIDVFTTLVFFLLITSTSVQTMRSPRELALPNSISTLSPTDAAVLMITPSEIQLQGRPVMTVEAAMSNQDLLLAPLQAELTRISLLNIEGRASDATTRGEINIMADRAVPYALLKKIMATCGEAKFARISLSVNHHGQMIAP
jgi:biopolymer transport protein TolR